MNFWEGFVKKAATAAKETAQAAIKPVEKLFKWDPMGGIASRSPEELSAAQQSDLVTFGKGVEGASCKNCQFMSPVGKRDGNNYGFCTKLNRFVTERQCCSQWDAPGTFREFETPDAAVVTPEEHAAATQELGGVQQQGIAENTPAMSAPGAENGAPQPPAPGMTQEQMPGLMDELSSQGMAGPAPGQPGAGAGGPPQAASAKSPKKDDKAPKKEDKNPKKDSSDKGGGKSEAKHTINIHVGAGGKEKK